MEAIFSHKKKSDQKLFRDFISLDLDKRGCIPDASNDCSTLEKLFVPKFQVKSFQSLSAIS